MTTYRKIHGRAIQAVTTDPSESVTEGQVWYNTNSDTFKSVIQIEAWSSGSAMIRNTSTAGANHALGAGIQTAAIYAGGYSPYTNKTEHYNGTGWTSGGNMNLTRITTGFGTETAAVAAGGITFPGVVGGQVEEYDGSSWTTGNALGTARPYGSGSGTLTAGLYAGGSPNASAATSVANSEEYNGTNWSEGNDLNTARRFLGSAATAPQTAALVFGGDNAPAPGTVRSFTETYDGTSWTEVGDLNTARRNMGGAGDFTSALAFGGSLGPPGNSTATESWNGSSWSTSPASLANARDSQPSIGTSTAALFVGGPNPAFPGGWVEEYNKSANVITGAAFSSGGAVPLANQDLASFGTQTAAIGAGGYSVPYTNAAYGYNGSSWTNLPNINTARTAEGAGTQTAGVIFGGNAPPADAFQNATEEWNGSSWTAVNNMVSAVSGDMAIGVAQTAVISVGGQSPAYPAREKQQEYDGTNWTAVSATLNNGRRNGSSHGTVTAALVAFGASPGPENVQNYAEEWNGSSWTSVPTANTARVSIKGFGTQTNAVASGGSNVGASVAYTQSERYNGTGWATAPSLANGRYNHGSAGVGSPTSLGLIFNGAPGYSTATEEFTDETTALNVKTLTQS
jgi:hypothetical protein